MTEEQKKDLAQAYSLMMESAAWKHFSANVLDTVEFIAVKNEDEIPLHDISLAEIGECRGRRNAIRKIRSDLSYILEGLK